MRKGTIILIALLLVLTALPVHRTLRVSAAGPAPQDGGQVYTIQSGDYLGKLAQEHYGDARKWPAIWKATNTQAQTDSSLATIDDPNIIEAGQKLWLPDAAEVDKWQAADWSASARIIDRDVIECFAGSLEKDDKPIYCETSAVAYDGTVVVLASDKSVPCDGCSPVFAVKYAGNKLDTASRQYYTATPFVDATKYEDMTVTPDNKYIIATTGFDRVKSDSAEWNNYNTLLVWPTGDPDAVKVVSPSAVDGVTSSVDLRTKFSNALKNADFPDGMPYFKVEGLAAIPGNKLLFGIRELGASYKEFDYAVKIVSASYTIEDGTLTLGDDFALIYDYSPVLRQQVALSSLEYDRYGDRLYLLTSYETADTDEGLGGYLWTLSMSDLNANNAPRLVFKDVLTPLSFAHKAEGVTVISANRVLVIHDDDRVLGRQIVENPETQFSRDVNQGAYTLVEFR